MLNKNWRTSLIAALFFSAASQTSVAQQATLNVERLAHGPIISPQTDASIGHNIQGPSLIRVPEWVKNPLGKYYLYFADHKGSYIRLAYANTITGPWTIYKPGALQLADSHFLTKTPEVPEKEAKDAITYMKMILGHKGRSDQQMLDDLIVPHIASPDAHVDHKNQQIVMYFHGLNAFASQVSRVATSTDGIHFNTDKKVIGRSYMRAVEHNSATYLLSMPGQFYRSADGLTGFEEGPKLFSKYMRHSALLKRGNTLHVLWTLSLIHI